MSDNTAFCTQCGKKLTGKKPRFCSKCGAPVLDEEGLDSTTTALPERPSRLPVTPEEDLEAPPSEPEQVSESAAPPDSTASELLDLDRVEITEAAGGLDAATNAGSPSGATGPRPAGYYNVSVAPGRAPELRYWSGSSWSTTAEVANPQLAHSPPGPASASSDGVGIETGGASPSGAPSAAPAGSPPAGYYPDPVEPTARPRFWTGSEWTTWAGESRVHGALVQSRPAPDASMHMVGYLPSVGSGSDLSAGGAGSYSARPEPGQPSGREAPRPSSGHRRQRPGTYADPFRAGESRFWDGAQWDYDGRDYKWQAEMVERRGAAPPSGEPLEPSGNAMARMAVSGAPARRQATRRRRFEIAIGVALGLAAIGIGIYWTSSSGSGSLDLSSASSDLPPGLSISNCKTVDFFGDEVLVYVSGSNTTDTFWDASLTVDVYQKGEVVDTITFDGTWGPGRGVDVAEGTATARYAMDTNPSSCKVAAASAR